MTLRLSISNKLLENISTFFNKKEGGFWVVVLATIAAAVSTAYCFFNDYIVRYGDSESHLNISKRVVDSITPGFAQLGGIWLPLPHLLMVPFIWIDSLWRSGLAGSIVSGVAFIIAALFIYKTVYLLTSHKSGSFIAALVFIINPNVLYLQATPMTEILLIAFFTLSSFYFIKFLKGQNQLHSLLFAAFYGFCSVLTRYDGWFLVVIQAGCILLYYLPWDKIYKPRELLSFFKSDEWKKSQGYIVLFGTLAFFGILLWLAWDFLILGDPLYFTHSEFSAKSQQNEWLSKGQLPGYHNLPLSFLYYLVTAMSNAGLLMFVTAIAGFIYFLTDKSQPHRLLIALILSVPFTFNVITQFLGQSVIFIPDLTPVGFDWNLFNVRYGVMTVPLVAVLIGYLFFKSRQMGKVLILSLILAQVGLFVIGYSRVVAWQDGVIGLSSAKRPDAERWIKDNYDYGLVLMDDYARTVSVVRSGIPMEQMIYVGNKPYWEESLEAPEKYARWVVMQQNDTVWKQLIDNPSKQGRLYKYFEKVYTSPEILIFRAQRTQPSDPQLFWNFQCIDTMKDSRDRARELANNPNLQTMINAQMSQIKNTGASCVSIGTPYDEEFVPYLEKWVTAARNQELNIWFKGNMSGWEGWFGYEDLPSVEQHHQGIRNLITKYPHLFKEGDIFTPAPEAENGILGDPRQSENNKKWYFDFLTKSYQNCLDSFLSINIPVTCGYFSMNGDIAKDIMTKEVLVTIGDILVIDHYVRTPEILSEDIQYLNEKFGSSIVLGEFGAPIPDIHGAMTEDEQAEYLEQTLEMLFQQQNRLLGINYWVLKDGTTALVNSDNTPRKAYDVVSKYFFPAEADITVTDKFGNPVPRIRIVSKEHNREVVTNELGQATLFLPSGKALIEITDDNWVGEKTFEIEMISGRQAEVKFVLSPARENIFYKIKVWFNNIIN